MKRWHWLLWLCAWVVGCGGPLTGEAALPGEAPEELAAPEPDTEVSAAWKNPRVELGRAYLVKDILPPEEQPPEAGSHGPGPMNLVDFEGRLYFTVDSALLGESTLWRSDGTTPGTIALLRASGSIDELTVVGDRLFFSARPLGLGDELWVSDGTVSGTVRLAPLPREFVTLHSFTAVGDILFFINFVPGSTFETGRHELWTSDGTPSGTRHVRDLGPHASPSLVGARGKLFFSLFDEEHGEELWVSDGTASGTRVLDLVPGPTGSSPFQLTVAGGALYFTLAHPDHVGELWMTDGTRKGTRLLADLGTGARLSLLSESNDRLYFLAEDPASTGLLLYKIRVDGSCLHRPVRVAAVPDFFPDESSVSPPFVSVFTSTGGKVFFVLQYETFSRDPFEAHLWVSNGTGSGTKLLARSPLEADHRVEPLTPVGDGRIVFSARDPGHGVEPWVSDGTPGGTRLLQDLVPGPGDSDPRDFTRSEDFIFFVAYTPETGNEPWALPLLRRGHHTAGR